MKEMNLAKMRMVNGDMRMANNCRMDNGMVNASIMGNNMMDNGMANTYRMNNGMIGNGMMGDMVPNNMYYNNMIPNMGMMNNMMMNNVAPNMMCYNNMNPNMTIMDNGIMGNLDNTMFANMSNMNMPMTNIVNSVPVSFYDCVDVFSKFISVKYGIIESLIEFKDGAFKEELKRFIKNNPQNDYQFISMAKVVAYAVKCINEEKVLTNIEVEKIYLPKDNHFNEIHEAMVTSIISSIATGTVNGMNYSSDFIYNPSREERIMIISLNKKLNKLFKDNKFINEDAIQVMNLLNRPDIYSSVLFNLGYVYKIVFVLSVLICEEF